MSSCDRIGELEAEVREARLVIACLVQMAGGQVDIPEELLVSIEPGALAGEVRPLPESGLRLSFHPGQEAS